MRKIILFSLFLVAIGIVVPTNPALAHPGRTDSSGCHTCRTNCPSWGLSSGEYHCHGGSSERTPRYTNPSCPSNATYSATESSCRCNSGYAPSLNRVYCVRIPENAHAVDSNTDVWLCDKGYQEYNNTCIPIPVEDCEMHGFETVISRIIDGDTVEFTCNEKSEKVRVIGIDTPETVHPSKPVQCFGDEASQKMKELVLDKKVTLERARDTENKDKYGRLLRYIVINGQDIGAEMIKSGYAFSYKTYPHEKLDEYNQLEKDARETKQGLWGENVCDYQYEEEESPADNTYPTESQNPSSSQVTQRQSILNKFINLLESFFK